jgi:hypothetical protein
MSVSLLTQNPPQGWENFFFNSSTSNSSGRVPISVSGTTTLTTSNTVNITSLGSAYNITLPAPSNGLNVKFTIVQTLIGAVTIKSASANIFGNLLSSDGTQVAASPITVGKTNVIVGTTSIPGDSLSFYSEGTNWFIEAVTGVHGSLTVS